MAAKNQSFGLNIAKKNGLSRPQPGKRKPIFAADDDSDGEHEEKEAGIEEIGEFGGLGPSKGPSKPSKSLSKAPTGNPPLKPLSGKKAPISMYGDLSASLTSKKHADAAEQLDANIYDYDGVYDSLKPKKKEAVEDLEKKPKYMDSLMKAAAIRKRDATIAEEKKLAREREAEGDEFADKEKFVTAAYKKQQEENRRIEEEERLKEELEAKRNKGAGMTNFYKNLLEKGEQRHAEVVKAVEERLLNGPKEEDEPEEEKEKTEAELAREINERLGTEAIAVNEDGQVVDKRQLLKGGLNITAKPKKAPAKAAHVGVSISDRTRESGFIGGVGGGGKQGMRERQSRMIEAQLDQAAKRAREEEEEERAKLERASKSTKTEGDIMSAKERYLARKRAAEEEKKKGLAD